MGNQLEELNELASDLTAAETNIALTRETESIARGKRLTVGLEEMYVWSFTAGSQPTVTVRRGFGMSTATTHTAGDLLRVNARWSDILILKAINAELRSLSSPSNGLFRVRTLDLTSSSPLLSYDLSGVSDLLSPIGVQVDTPGVDNSWPYVAAQIRRNQSPDDFSSGLALRVDDSLSNGRPMRLVYRAPFSELTTLTQDVTNVSGLPPSAHDIPSLGAAARLMGTYEARRSFVDSQPDTRRASEVSPGSAARSASVLSSLRQKRIGEEKARLQQLYPDRKWA